MIHLFYHPDSPYADRVLMFMNILNIPFELHKVELEKKENRALAYRAKNPAMRVPTIVHGDFHLSESNAILRYLAARFEKYDFYPIHLEARAEVDRWMDFTNQHVCKHLIDLAWNRALVFQYGGKSDQAIIEKAEHSLKRDFGVVEDQLLKKRFLCGSRPTLADVALFPFVKLSEMAKWPLEKYSATMEWYKSWFV